MSKAEWWTNECGGVLCSNCGLFHDDHFGPAPSTCPICGSRMTANDEMYVHNDYRLSTIHSNHYIDKSEYPSWLLILRNSLEQFIEKNDGIYGGTNE